MENNKPLFSARMFKEKYEKASSLNDKIDTILLNAGYEAGYPDVESKVMSLIGDRDMYSKDAMEWKAKASKLNAEKRKFMDIVNNQATNSQDMFCEYKDWLATRNGKGEK